MGRPSTPISRGLIAELLHRFGSPRTQHRQFSLGRRLLWLIGHPLLIQHPYIQTLVLIVFNGGARTVDLPRCFLELQKEADFRDLRMTCDFSCPIPTLPVW